MIRYQTVLTQHGESCSKTRSALALNHDQFLSERHYGNLRIFDVELRIDDCWVHKQSYHSSLGYRFAQNLKALEPHSYPRGR